jgi:serine phosphatase RsbU (regulator of sigma subunit)/energy-coupling factor transporter transmembrane protein EcfT
MRRRTRLWLLAGLALLVAAVVVGVAFPDSVVLGLLIAVLWLWVVVTVAALLWRLWQRVTYRVSVRLLLSYLLLGVTPFAICAALGGAVLYMAAGQYTSVRFGDEMDRLMADLDRDAREIATVHATSGLGAATEAFHTAAGRPRHLVPTVLWRASLGGTTLVGPGAEELPDLGWMSSAVTTTGRLGDRLFGLVAAPVGDSRGWVAALVPLDDEAARAISRNQWYDIYFTSVADRDQAGAEVEGEPAGESAIMISSPRESTISVDSRDVRLKEVWEPWPESSRGVLHRPWVHWFRLNVDVLDLGTGQPSRSAISLLRTSPMKVWEDVTRSRYELAGQLWGAVTGLGVFLLALYALALTIAGTMIVSITRAVARLTKGARAVEEGRFDERIPVRRHDQLGDLALSFNRMAESVEGMLADVAEKERLARELELAREIQESLLPARRLRHGTLEVRATFRPAAAVGGDYFDVFPVDERRLVVVIGDVAGHGLHTGLLMAGLKSTVAALIWEGYSGEELVSRVNGLLGDRRLGPIMTTLAVAEIELAAGLLRITNAGHPPAYLVADGRCEELMAGSLPLGSARGRPAQLERPFPPGARLLLYSDGLVEAAGPSGEPFSYERLAATVRDNAAAPAAELEAAIVEALDRHRADRALADDLTLIVVERDGGGAGA